MRRKAPDVRFSVEAALDALRRASSPSHLAGYVSEVEGRRQLPAGYINNFEVSCGNRCISQWLAAQANLTILETFLQQRAA